MNVFSKNLFSSSLNLKQLAKCELQPGRRLNYSPPTSTCMLFESEAGKLSLSLNQKQALSGFRIMYPVGGMVADACTPDATSRKYLPVWFVSIHSYLVPSRTLSSAPDYNGYSRFSFHIYIRLVNDEVALYPCSPRPLLRLCFQVCFFAFSS